jgi:membrane protease YdiL (CAAX protease family)
VAWHYSRQAETPDEILIRRFLPWINGAVLAGCAVFSSYPGREYVLIGLMLFLPLFDHGWRIPALPRSLTHYLAWAGLFAAGIAILAWRPSETPFALTTLVTAALPEEWFFRAYFMSRLGGGMRSNVLASLLFSLLHGLTRGWIAAALVFAPSLFYGWLYQRTRDFPLLTLVHALSNLVYAVFLAQFVATFIGNLR